MLLLFILSYTYYYQDSFRAGNIDSITFIKNLEILFGANVNLDSIITPLISGFTTTITTSSTFITTTNKTTTNINTILFLQ